MSLALKTLARPKHDPRFDQAATTTCPTLADAGSVLRTRRRELGWSQDTAAEVCGFNQRMISEIERGARGVSYDRVALYASRLGIDLSLSIRDKQ